MTNKDKEVYSKGDIMKTDETNYGNFAEPKESKNSKRGEEVILSAINSLESAMKKIKKLERQNKKLNEELHKCYAKLDSYEFKQIYKGDIL